MSTGCAALEAFVSAALVDLLLARWTLAVAARQRLRAAGLSMLCATSTLAGLDLALGEGSYVVRACWVLGYGAGSWLAVQAARR